MLVGLDLYGADSAEDWQLGPRGSTSYLTYL